VQRWDEVHDKESPIEDFTEGQDARWADPTGEAAVKTNIATETLNSISDPRTRHAAHMVMLGPPSPKQVKRLASAPLRSKAGCTRYARGRNEC